MVFCFAECQTGTFKLLLIFFKIIIIMLCLMETSLAFPATLQSIFP